MQVTTKGRCTTQTPSNQRQETRVTSFAKRIESEYGRVAAGGPPKDERHDSLISSARKAGNKLMRRYVDEDRVADRYARRMQRRANRAMRFVVICRRTIAVAGSGNAGVFLPGFTRVVRPMCRPAGSECEKHSDDAGNEPGHALAELWQCERSEVNRNSPAPLDRPFIETKEAIVSPFGTH